MSVNIKIREFKKSDVNKFLIGLSFIIFLVSNYYAIEFSRPVEGIVVEKRINNMFYGYKVYFEELDKYKVYNKELGLEIGNKFTNAYWCVDDSNILICFVPFIIVIDVIMAFILLVYIATYMHDWYDSLEN